MKFKKRVIHHMTMPYALGATGPGPSPSVACAPEDRGALFVIDPPYREAHALAPGPGGCMSLVFDPERPSDLYSVMGCFVGYNFQGGGIYRIRDGGTPERVLDLPFAHRIGVVRRGVHRYLLAASLTSGKKDPSDWSQPGGVYAAELDTEPTTGLHFQPVLAEIHKNHGFLLVDYERRPSLLIGGSEGLLAFDLTAPERQWPVHQVLPGEISEVALFDVDADGSAEIITIEPFHGNALRAYRGSPAGWRLFWEAELNFGHCVLAGMLHGQRSVLVSNRAGGKELLLFQFPANASEKPRRIVVEEGAGAANMLVVTYAGKDHILSANQVSSEIVLYTADG